jgi:hypothetical protein
MQEYLIDGKAVNYSSLEVDGVDSSDYPDFCDAYLDSGEFEDGTQMTDEQLDLFRDMYGLNELAYETLL